jgi:hypothetical protein
VHAVSILVIQKSEPDIYIGFSLALHLKCMPDYAVESPAVDIKIILKRSVH